MRKKDENTRQNLLSAAREIAFSEGPQAINVRVIAKKAGVASGTVYNYFQNKEEILLALTEEYWREVLWKMRKEITETNFLKQLEQAYVFLQQEMDQFGSLLMNSLAQAQTEAQFRMGKMQQVLGQMVVLMMQKDDEILVCAWNDELTQEEFATFVVSNISQMLRMNLEDISYFIEIIKRVLYRKEEKNGTSIG